MSRDDNRRTGTDFIAEKMARDAEPAVQRAIERDMRREGLVKKGEQVIVDGRISSEMAHRYAAHVGRRDDNKDG